MTIIINDTKGTELEKFFKESLLINDVEKELNKLINENNEIYIIMCVNLSFNGIGPNSPYLYFKLINYI